MTTRNPFTDSAPTDLLVEPEEPERAARPARHAPVDRDAPLPAIGRRDRRWTRGMVRGARRPAGLAPTSLG